MTAERDLTMPPPRSGFGTRMILGLLILAFVGGALLMAWLAQNWRSLNSVQQIAGNAANSGDVIQNAAGPADASTALPAIVTPGMVDAQAVRMADMEQRLARITIAAQAASYNANRAEALMTAFAVRRSLDAGRPLGYIEGTLRLRFGDAQPKAVATIVNAAAEPVTLADLRLGLQDVDALTRSQRNSGSWWQAMWREVGSLAILRRAGAPSPEPEQRLDRARHAVELGQIDAAIAEMSALPPQLRVTRWLELARRYNEAHRALDVIEAAAILEPRAGPGAAGAAIASPAPVVTAPDTEPAASAAAAAADEADDPKARP
ncbi:hypothetical protein BH10PSE13_BH10PSE13_17970 [soil metagenome]